MKSWPLDPRITVVLFAGLGGACQGLEAAGFPVGVAVNHDEIAIAAHKTMNPHTRHLHADIYEVDPLDAVCGRPVGILWGSPDCRDHSVAKGGAPRSPRVRSMPWQLCRWAGVLRKRGLGPDKMFLENVREIRGWGPLIAKRCKTTGRVVRLDGRIAAAGERVPVQQQQLVRDPRHVGRIYRAWRRHIEALGAVYEDRDMHCAEYGVPTTRKRLFGVADFNGEPIFWPAITHAPRGSEAVKTKRLKPFARAADLIDRSLPLPSIFDRARPHAEATRRRVAIGVKRFVLDAAAKGTVFLVSMTHHGSDRVHDGENPAPTMTTAHRGEFAVCAPVIVGAGGRAAQMGPIDAGGPLNTSTTKEDRCLVGASLIQTSWGERVGQAPRVLDIETPLGTQMAGGIKHAVVGAFLTELRGTATADSVEDPLKTQTAGGNHTYPTAAFLTEYYGSGGQHQDAGKPLNTLSTRDRFAVHPVELGEPPLSPAQYARARDVAEFLRAYGVWTGGELVTLTIARKRYVIVDIGMRMLTVDEAAAAHGLQMPKSITIGGVTRPLNKTEGMRLVGNSVPPRMAELLALANMRRPLDMAGAAE